MGHPARRASTVVRMTFFKAAAAACFASDVGSVSMKGCGSTRAETGRRMFR